MTWADSPNFPKMPFPQLTGSDDLPHQDLGNCEGLRKAGACVELHTAPPRLACTGECKFISNHDLPAPPFLFLAFRFFSSSSTCLYSRSSPKLLQVDPSAVDETSPDSAMLRHWGTQLSKISALAILPFNCFTVVCQGCPCKKCICM